MSYRNSDSFIEKTFLYLFALSLLLHVAFFAFIIYFPQAKKVAKSEPIMVDLEEMPELKAPSAKEEKGVKRAAPERRRVTRETAPKGEMGREKIAPAPAPPAPLVAQPQKKGGEVAPLQAEKGREPSRETLPGEKLVKRKDEGAQSLAKLFPSPGKMARLEESYRKKYSPEVEEGETRFLNTDDILFGSFLRRFETAVYGVWSYPAEAAKLGIEGVTPVKITFNRKGEIEKIDLLESSGSRILDEEVMRTLHLIGPVGSFPRGYKKDKFYLIAFFQYGITRGMSRGVLH